MATGGASQLAALTGLHPLAVPLLWLAVAEAIVIPLLGVVLRRSVSSALRCLVCSAPASHLFGDFTVPLGLAVIGTGLAQGSGPAFGLGCAAVVLAWLTTIALTAEVVVPVMVRRPTAAVVNGTWFLAPAAALGAAIGTKSVLLRLPVAVRPSLEWLALIGCALGVVGYLVVVGLAATRVVSTGLRGAPLSPWWISAGCGGLAAATIGQVAAVAPGARAIQAYCVSALVAWSIGSVLLVPVLFGSLAYLRRLRRLQASPPWPPTFSTAVYALGALQVDRLSRLHVVGTVGQVAGLATVALWFATAALYVLLVPRRLRGEPGNPGKRRNGRDG